MTSSTHLSAKHFCAKGKGGIEKKTHIYPESTTLLRKAKRCLLFWMPTKASDPWPVSESDILTGSCYEKQKNPWHTWPKNAEWSGQTFQLQGLEHHPWRPCKDDFRTVLLLSHSGKRKKKERTKAYLWDFIQKGNSKIPQLTICLTMEAHNSCSVLLFGVKYPEHMRSSFCTCQKCCGRCSVHRCCSALFVVSYGQELGATCSALHCGGSVR